MSKRVRVFLHGSFTKFHDGPIEIVANTAWEAIEAVTYQVKGFLPDPVNGRKRIQAAGFLTVESLHQPLLVEEIHLLPAMMFGKNLGLIQTIIGVTMIVSGFLLSATPFGVPLMAAGLALTVGGLMQIISPQPQLNAGNENDVRSKYLPTSVNTVAIGTTIPLLYGGPMRCGGHVMSLNIDAKDTGI